MENLARIIGTLLLTYRFIIVPSVLILLPISHLLLKKNTLRKLGEFKINNIHQVKNRKIKILSLLLPVFGFYFIFLKAQLVGYFYIALGIYQLFDDLAIKKYKNLNGIYENGLLVNRESMFWKELHSWKFKKDNEVIEILNAKGYRFDLYFDDSKLAIDLLEKKLRNENETK